MRIILFSIISLSVSSLTHGMEKLKKQIAHDERAIHVALDSGARDNNILARITEHANMLNKYEEVLRFRCGDTYFNQRDVELQMMNEKFHHNNCFMNLHLVLRLRTD